jgi:hypothetical protein
MSEKWKPCGSGYECSNLGRIRKGRRIIGQQRWGKIACCKINGRTCSVPRLIASAWLGLRANDRRRVRYKRGRSNRVSNLYLARLRGVECPRHTLTNSEVLAIYKSSKMQATLAGEYGVSKSCISHIQNGRTWDWLTRATRE